MVGPALGSILGIPVGGELTVGAALLEDFLEPLEGAEEIEGKALGMADGAPVGRSLGCTLGADVGPAEGIMVGPALGSTLGIPVGGELTVGAALLEDFVLSLRKAGLR